MTDFVRKSLAQAFVEATANPPLATRLFRWEPRR
jgi:hypothetical protein